MSNSAPIRLTPALRALLARIDRGEGKLLMVQVVSSGGRANRHLNALRRAGYVVKADHSTVMHQGYPAEALAITAAGKAALETTDAR